MKYKAGDKVILTNGDIMTVEQINDISKWYLMREDPLNCYTDQMIKGLVEEPVLSATNITDGIFISEKDMKWTTEYILPDGYIFKDENGNVINATKIVLEKKKKEYPKTYEECCEIVKVGKEHTLEGATIRINYKIALLESFQKLLICRDAYWKIAGDEMGLGKPWKPDGNPVYAITRNDGCIVCIETGGNDEVFEFPTKEMRDAFYENFKELIEICKELL